MNKRYIKIAVAIVFCFIATDSVYASGFSIKASSYNATKNNNITVTTSVSADSGIYTIGGTMSCSGAGVNKSTGLNYDDLNTSARSKSFSYTIRPTSTGTITCSSNVKLRELARESEYSLGSKRITINVGSPSSSSGSSSRKSTNNSRTNTNNSNNENSESADTTLKSLSVEGQSLEFDKNKTIYNLSVGNDIEKIKISAEASDPKATVTGTGEKYVKEGDNKFDIVVTSEDGDKRTYTINVNVDSEPITVTVGGKKYTLVKKKEELPELTIEHEDMTLNFEGQDIPAYRIDKISFVLVGLRDSKGNIKLYKYDAYKGGEKPDKYTLFRQFTTPQMFISYLEFPKKLIPDGYKKYKEKINGEKVTVYKLSKDSDYCLFYGINIETGEKNIYKYETSEKTIQIYDREELESLEKDMEMAKYIFIGLVAFSALLLIIIVIICATRKRKFKKMIKKYESKKMAKPQA